VERLRSWAPGALAAAFLGSGVVHLVRPQILTPIVPRVLPARTALVYVSGITELTCAAGLARGARWAGPASAALLIAVLPANVQMALDATAAAARRGGARRIVFAVGSWVRVPLQAPLVWAALQSGRRRD
jgi:uncharacterized membrane protein